MCSPSNVCGFVAVSGRCGSSPVWRSCGPCGGVACASGSCLCFFSSFKTEEMVLELMRRCMVLAATTAAPLLLVGMAVGLLIAIFQAATQIQEASLNFVPKLVAIGLLMLVVGPWMLETIVTFTRILISEMAYLAPGASR